LASTSRSRVPFIPRLSRVYPHLQPCLSLSYPHVLQPPFTLSLLSLSFPFLLPLPDMSHRSALLLVDVQNDFLPPNGSLAVPSGDTIISILHRLLDLEFDLVIASQVRWSIATSHSLGQTDDLCLNRIIIPEVMFRSLLVTPLAKLSTPSKCNIQSLVQTRIKSCGRTTAYRVRQEQISRRA